MTRRRLRASLYALLTLAALTALLTAGCDDDTAAQTAPTADATETPAGSQDETPTATSTATPEPTQTPEGDARADIGPEDTYADLVEQVRGSVVAVLTTAETFQGTGEGLGSGFVVSNEGHIVTNYHVIAGADEIAIALVDGTITPAQVLGTDPANDIAVLQVDLGDNLPEPVTFGDSDEVRVGDKVLAIGSPFGLRFTVTSGIISAVDRDDLISPAQRVVIDALQTDAAINPGNSGGPLFSMGGEVIGVNTAIQNPSGDRVFIGIGLAVPSNNVTRFLDEMKQGEDIVHPALGIAGLPITPETAEVLGLTAQEGVYVLAVQPGSAADQAGIQGAEPPSAGQPVPRGGDVIVEFAGEEVTSLDQLRELVDQREVGETVDVTVLRDGEEVTLQVTLQEWEVPEPQGAPGFPFP